MHRVQKQFLAALTLTVLCLCNAKLTRAVPVTVAINTPALTGSPGSALILSASFTNPNPQPFEVTAITGSLFASPIVSSFARLLLKALNDTTDERQEERARLIRELIPGAGKGAWIESPFYCDYGSNITLGERVFFNFNCVILDVAQVLIGSRVLFGPGVQLYTATHPLSAVERRRGLEFALPVEVGDDVWVGGGAIICPGVKIGMGSVIGAGSVVTKDIPAGAVAAGNPCRVIRRLND